MSDARDVQLVLAHPPSGYTPLFPPAEVLNNAQNFNRRICYFLFVICYFISCLTRAGLWQRAYLDRVQRRHDRGPPNCRPLPKDEMRAGSHSGRACGRSGGLRDRGYDH